VQRPAHEVSMTRSITSAEPRLPRAVATLRKRPDWVGLLDAVYAPAADDVAWGRGVVEAARSIFLAGELVGLNAIEHSPDGETGRILVTITSGSQPVSPAEIEQGLRWVGPEVLTAYYYPSRMVGTHSEIALESTPHTNELVRQIRRSMGVEEAIGVVVHPEPGVALVLLDALPAPASVTRNERSVLTQLGLHLENAYRLRRRPAVARGRVRVGGRVDLERALDELGPALAAQAKDIESARRPARQRDGAALDLWRALVGGRFSLVPEVENGSRSYLVVENPPRSQAMRALSRREASVLELAARGVTAKLVSYGLGLSPSQVSGAMRSAAAKVGVATRLDLVRVAAMLTGDFRAGAPPATLTEAEGAIFELLRQGLSNSQIAALRSRSVRTIANQVASLLRKTHSPSRRALLVCGA
jgi:DNA-binding CsgD family transcriptional regulator